jgi:hypothetical protein
MRHRSLPLRHQSAANFVEKHPECAAFVCSQDGKLTLFCRAMDKKSVAMATRIDWLIDQEHQRPARFVDGPKG